MTEGYISLESLHWGIYGDGLGGIINVARASYGVLELGLELDTGYRYHRYRLKLKT